MILECSFPLNMLSSYIYSLPKVHTPSLFSLSLSLSSLSLSLSLSCKSSFGALDTWGSRDRWSTECALSHHQLAPYSHYVMEIMVLSKKKGKQQHWQQKQWQQQQP